MNTVVVGAGVGGLASALTLARDGHAVTLLERDRTPMPATAEDAFGWDRRGAPQVRHSHVLLARLRNLIRDRFPDVREAMLGVGMEERSMLDDLPETIDDPDPRPGDQDLVILAARRTTFEWVLRSKVLAESNVTLIDGLGARGLTWANERCVGVSVDSDTDSDESTLPGRPAAGRPPSKVETIDGDLVVVANGRRSNLAAWASELDIDLDEDVVPSGIVYLSRFYRRRPGTTRPDGAGFGVADLGYLKAGLFPCDNDALSITLAIHSDDTGLRKRLAEPATFHRAAQALPNLAPWLIDGDVEPISDVEFMAGLINRRRRFVVDGALALPGVAAVGDAHTCTNPIYGRGCSLAFVMADSVAAACREHPDDATARGLAYEAAVKTEVAPWHRASVAADAAAQAAGREMRPGGSFGPALGTALRTDATLLRAFLRTLNLLATPETLMTDPDLLTRIAAAADREPIAMDTGPANRAEFLALLD